MLISQHINYSAVYILAAWAISLSCYTNWLKRILTETLNFTFRYIDDVLSLNNSRFVDFVDRIYPIQLEIKDTTVSARSSSYLDLHLEIDNEGRLRTKLDDKGDHLNFPHYELSIYM